MSDRKIKYLELFAGVGGFRLAMERAAKSVAAQSVCVGFSEIDSNALKTYRANFDISDDEIDIGDVMSLGSPLKMKKTLPDFDILLAGFPCQPFSLMGLKEGFDDSRGTLFFQIAAILSAKKPEYFILENVRGLKTHDDGKTFERIMEILDSLGYMVRTEILNSVDFGVPQIRRRLFFIGTRRKENFDKIQTMNLAQRRQGRFKTTWHLLEKEVDDKYYLSKKILKTILADGSGNYHSKSEINRIYARPLTASMHKMHRANQDNYYSNDYINGAFKDDQVTLASSALGKDVRRITPLEAFRLQGFDDKFAANAKEAGVSDTQLYRQAGNAITVNVAADILGKIFRTS